MTGHEIPNISQAYLNGSFSGNGVFTKKCNEWFEAQRSGCKALLTHSCTAALEMAAILADIQPGDEIIMPSYTFVSSANAFVMRGGIPVFIDIKTDTLNIDETLIESAITSRTKAILVVHYAGVACEMDVIMDIANRHNLIVIEDAAQAIMSTYKGIKLGTIGDFGAYSFHETKNIICGEGGALLINKSKYIQRAEIIWEKGTNRNKFFRGEIDKYTWVDIGSSYLPGELMAAFLWAQLNEAEFITNKRHDIWNAYNKALYAFEERNKFRRPVIPKECHHNAHMYYIIMESLEERNELIRKFRDNGIGCVFHYVPLHSAPAGLTYGRFLGDMKNTNSISERILRLPIWIGFEKNQDEVLKFLYEFYE